MSRQHLGQKSGQGSCLGSGSLLLKQTRPVTVPLLCFFFFLIHFRCLRQDLKAMYSTSVDLTV